MSPRLPLITGLALAWALVPRTAEACSCLRSIGPCEAFGAPVVFVGTVDSVQVVGGRYLIFSHGTADRVFIQACMHPVPLLPGEPDPEFPPFRGRVYGRVYHDRPAAALAPRPFDPVTGARLWIDLPTGRVAATSDAWGRFTFSDVPPGTYRIGVEPGPGFTARDGPRVDVDAGRRCAMADVLVDPASAPRRD